MFNQNSREIMYKKVRPDLDSYKAYNPDLYVKQTAMRLWDLENDLNVVVS